MFLVVWLIGTDTAGSVRVPAAFCGILGFRPSHAAISVSGVIPMSQSFDTVGNYPSSHVFSGQAFENCGL